MTASHPVEMTLAQIGRIVGGLPPSAFRWSPWWANAPGHVQAVAWLEAGRRANAVDLAGQRVTFG